MSKSYGNSIFICDRGEELSKKIMSMFTDPQRMRKKDPGRPELCNVFSFHQLYSEPADFSEIEVECRKAGVGCIECKRRLAVRISEELQPVHERQDYYRSHMDEVGEIIEDGNLRARRIAEATMDEVRKAVKI